jgi:DNA helicase-2/ATP-dependent DNA helicase PcrA
VRCRVCGKALIEAVDRKLGRCADCPSDLDQALFQRLRDWRAERAREQSLPAYCVFTDATLTAIAETRPTERGALAKIPGVGSAKLERYADQVLTILTGPAPAPVPGSAADAGPNQESDSGPNQESDSGPNQDSGSALDAGAEPAAGEETQETPWPAEEGA